MNSTENTVSCGAETNSSRPGQAFPLKKKLEYLKHAWTSLERCWSMRRRIWQWLPSGVHGMQFVLKKTFIIHSIQLRTSFRLCNRYRIQDTHIRAVPKLPKHELDPWKQTCVITDIHLWAKSSVGQTEVSWSWSKSGGQLTITPHVLSVTRVHKFYIL